MRHETSTLDRMPWHRTGNTSVRRVILVIGISGLIATLAATLWLWRSEQQTARTTLENRTQVIVDSTERALAEAELRLASISGLYQASREVTELEFRRFVKKLGMSAGMNAIGYMPMVMGRNRTEYEASTGLVILDVDPDGDLVPAADRRVHFPLQWFEPTYAFGTIEGFDSMSNPARAEALELARATRDTAASSFLRLVSRDESDGFLLYWPMTDAETDAFSGYATAAMDLSQLIEASIPGSFRNTLTWRLEDVTESASVATGIPGVALIEAGGRLWQIEIVPEQGSPSDMTPDPRSSFLLLAVGLLGTSLVAGGVQNHYRGLEARRESTRLRELNQAKDQFLASVGHELRTPLTTVLGFAELLRSDHDDLTETERIAMFSSIAEEASDLASIVDDLLVAARSELDLVAVTRVPVSARAQVAQVLEARGSEAVRISVIEEAGKAARGIGDPARVRQILRNMITNALRYGGERVEVRLGAVEGYVTIQVADNGAGVPIEDQELIFLPYHRAHSSESQPAALGIGLSVARQLSRLMGGDLIYRREDGWTIFELRLPTEISATDQSQSAASSLAVR